MHNYTIHSKSVPEPPAELVAFVKRQIRDARLYNGPERRSEERHLMAVPVVVQPIDEHSNPTGAPFAAVTRDISPTGVGLVHGESVEAKLLALRMHLGEEEVNLAVEVKWCRAFGPYHYVGGKPISKLASFPHHRTERAPA